MKKKTKTEILSVFYVNLPVTLYESTKNGKPRFHAELDADSLAIKSSTGHGSTPVEAVQNLKNKIRGSI